MFYKMERKSMVDELKKRKIIISDSVYNAMLKVPRHLFMPEDLWHRAYLDTPQPIAQNQTISAPHMNAMMCEYLELKEGHKVLEIGTGSGYHAALLAELVGKKGKVFTIERHEILAERAKKVLNDLGYENIKVIIGDGSIGYEKEAPYDRILVTAASPKIIRELMFQLKEKEGKLCIPIGKSRFGQDLYVFTRVGDKFTKNKMCQVVFVPLIGKNGFEE